MNIIVLLSAGRDPQSGTPRPVPVELQAIAIALALATHVAPTTTITGLHAGEPDPSVLDALGHGLTTLTLLRINPADDPLAALAAEIDRARPDLILAGRRGRGGTDSGLLPYRLARARAMPIAADAIAIEPDGDDLAILQSLPRGARRRLTLAQPAIVTIHEAAPPARAFAYRARRNGTIHEKPGIPAPSPTQGHEIRPYRQRPRLIAETTQPTTAGHLMLAPTPETAAAAVLAYVEQFRRR
jgi:electron transfer flavoprotein beta subunit